MPLQPLRTEVILDMTRKGAGDHLRVVFHKAKTEEGQIVAWHSIELGKVSEEGKFMEKSSVSIRGGELRSVLEVLHRACFGDPPPGAQLPLELQPCEEEPPF
jgi:hypothetical protein